MSNKLNTTQKIASDVVSTFIARAEESSDVNQLAFDSIIKETLTTVGFGQCFEQLLVRKNFQLKTILDVFSKASRECVFDTYADNDDAIDQSVDISLTDEVMGIALSRSRLMQQLIIKAEDAALNL